jgi:hypothetical protein
MVKQMRLRYAGTCQLCGTSIPAGTQAVYESETKTVRCLECPTEVDGALPAQPGTAGASARRE